ncbi:MAG: hypothetical protein ACK55Z_02530 [bacterium]
MTHGDRRSNMDGKNINMMHFNFDSKYGKRALDTLMHNIRFNVNVFL